MASQFDIEDAPPFPYYGGEPQYDMSRQIMPSGYQSPGYGGEVFSGSPASEIDLANASASMPRVYATPGANAYEAEQQAIEMRDPRVAFAVQKQKVQAEEDAIRFSGQKEFEQLVSGGATPEEALRRTAGKLFYNHPDKMATALGHIPAAGTVPNTLPAVPIIGPDGRPIGNAVYSSGGKLHATQFAPPERPPPEVVATQKIASQNVDSLRRELERAKKVAGLDPGDRDAARLALSLQRQLMEAEKGFVQGSTNWMQPKAAPAAAADFSNPARMSPATAPDRVKVTKDGKQFWLPKSQLDEAQGQGYKLVP